MAPRWTAQETAALRIGVDRYGKGKWKVIRQEFKDILESRSGEELKDKWRRITNKHDDTAAALANAYEVLAIPPPAVPLAVGPPVGPPAAGPLVGPPAAGPLVGPLAVDPLVGPLAPLVIPDGDAPSPKEVDDDEEDVDGDDDEDEEEADEMFEENYGKSLRCKDSFKEAYFYSRGRGIWCKYKETTQDLLRVAFKEGLPFVQEELSGNRIRLIFIYRMTDYSLWKEGGAKARPMGWMDTSEKMHFPDHLDRLKFTLVLKDGEETFVSTPKVMTALKNEKELGNLNSDMSKMAGKALGHYEELYEWDEGLFVDTLEKYANEEFLTLLGKLV